MTIDPIPVTLTIAEVLERLGISYVVGGSVASTLFGEPRTTMDVDLTVQLEPSRAPELDADFYVQRNAVEEAAALRVHCNVIHRATMIKVDIYVRAPEGIYASEIGRGRRTQLRDEQVVTSHRGHRADGRAATPFMGVAACSHR